MTETTSVIMTVKNDRAGCAVVLASLSSQTRTPDEVVVVDGGSTDGTLDVIRHAADSSLTIKLIESPATNIAQGRNMAASVATGSIIACTDAGCRLAPDWLEKLLERLERDADVAFVAGFYQLEAHTLLEQVVGLATMRGQLDAVDPETFNPSARSMACRKRVWSQAGGWPEWLCFSEDTLFDHKVRKLNVGWAFADEAIAYWRPRGSLRSIAKQFYRYGTGRGQTQIDAPAFLYNLRNIGLVLAAAIGCLFTNWAAPVLVGLMAYFYVIAFHRKSVGIVKRTGRLAAYPVSLTIHWIVLISNLAGFVVGSWQRWRYPDRFARRMERYLSVSAPYPNAVAGGS